MATIPYPSLVKTPVRNGIKKKGPAEFNILKKEYEIVELNKEEFRKSDLNIFVT